MNSALVIKSFCNSKEKIEVLKDAIKKLRELSDYPILLHAGFNVPNDVIELVDYYIYYDNSEFYTGISYKWQRYNSVYRGEFRSITYDYGFADAMQLKVCSSFLENLGFNIAHIFNYDVDLDQLQKMGCLEKNIAEINKGYEAAYHKINEYSAGLLFYSVNVNSFNSKVSRYINKESWVSEFYKTPDSLGENGFYEIFSRLESISTMDNILLNDHISTKWADDNALEGYVSMSGIYKTKKDSWIICAFMENPLDATIIIDGNLEINISEKGFVAKEIFSYPKKVEIKIKGSEELIDFYTDSKLLEMEKKLEYHDTY